ncbi:hypothetical protein TMatcc_007978 [Talaromyces marneffei ATCC 18224]|uniref:Fungal specific transcription factor, putative n=2 Tax=Talaromyces marneffei TaxID=37727 RepID=B6QE34_TALMQ|nr:uncharacterized protein EYB26_004887 [Talaromyces marneffei]EEA24879.1 fungal specific transcription factor, putative [Talaromyces marneffei ATCC 18224]KAE8552647.1 hypothetical protein EYB25_004026 [Talaromyces marneffei]QGA17217.1 hypothetical protein EYB26_004887 [Talaromyces marneffei]
MKFISHNAETISHKRKHARRACEQCRRGKRRCTHTLSLDPHAIEVAETASRPRSAIRGQQENLEYDSEQGHGLAIYSGTPENAKSIPRSRHSIGELLEAAQYSNQEGHHDSSLRASRTFIGHLNPETVFRSATSPGTTTRGQSSQNSVGTWLVDSLGSTGRESENLTTMPNSIFYNPSPATQKMLTSLFETEFLAVLPPTPYLSQLLSFYVEEIHPILPLIDIKSFQGDIDRNSKVLLSQAMCLLASMNPQCKSLLYLPDENEPLAPRIFGRRIFCAMRCAIDFGAVTNRMVLIQALGSLSLFTEGPEGPEIASQLCAKMIQLVQTLGLHIQRGSTYEEEYEVTCFCCAWALDRLNAAIHGRSVLMHERDIGIDVDKCFESQKPAFRLFLSIISQLDQVIDLYRPHAMSKGDAIELNHPQFDDMVVSAQCTNLNARLLSTIEVFYYAVAILSCRSTHKPSNNHVRQIYAASKINSILEQDIQNHNSLLIFLPFIPYAVSLSLSISYNQMRHTKVAMYRSRAREELQSTCDLLERLGTHFYVASAMASMGKATVAELDRVSENVLREKNSDDPSHDSQRRMGTHPRNDQLVAASVPEGPDNLETTNYDLPSTVNEFSISDIDVFDMFDPNFGLENVDAVFQNNLDLSMPMYLPFYAPRSQYGQMDENFS